MTGLNVGRPASEPGRGPAPRLEPSAPRPEHTYHFDASAKHEIGMWALGGAGVGGVAGLAFKLLEPLDSAGARTNGWWFLAAPLIGAAIAAPLAAAVGWFENGISQSKAEEQRINNEYGSPILGSAQDLVHQFDRDDSGDVNIADSSGLQSRNEAVRPAGSQRTGERMDGSPLGNLKREHIDWWDRDRLQSTFGEASAAKLLRAADTSSDGVVTVNDVALLMARFDTDGSGTLTTSEQQAFLAAHPLDYEYDA